MITLQTNYGNIQLELFENTTDTSKNFLEYAKEGFYDGTVFHRVIKGFMIQGGGFTAEMKQKSPKATIKNEANQGNQNVTGTIAMARTSEPHSASSQFFINVADNDFLDFKSETPQGWGYCVFGKVIAGMDIVNQISLVKTTSKNGHQDVPVEDVIIEKVIID
jgi:peptidyl-prolyl cis-trans isomerase B (cyclophilin B)